MNRRQRLVRALDRLDAIYSPSCLLCEIRCGVDRAAGERGVCGLAEHTPIYRHLVHLGEERRLVPSYAVWLSGCNFHCSFCSDIHALRPPLPGRVLSPESLAQNIATDLAASRLEIRNINFVGGEPSVSLPFLAQLGLALLDEMDDVPPFLLNTNGYLTEEALQAAIDLADIFIVDAKFGPGDCAKQLGAPKRTWEIVERNLRALAASGRELWVRHLLMPDHLDCCMRPILELLESIPQAHVNVMPAFVAFNEPWRSLRKDEIERARRIYEGSKIQRKYWDGERLAE